MLKLFGGSQQVSNILLNQKSPLCKLGLGGEQQKRESQQATCICKSFSNTHDPKGEDGSKEACSQNCDKSKNFKKQGLNKQAALTINQEEGSIHMLLLREERTLQK